MKLSLAVAPDFNFWSSVCSHGWCTLSPFEADKKAAVLKRPLMLSDGRVLVAEMSQGIGSRLSIKILGNFPGARSLGKTARREIIAQIRSCLRLDEDYTDFYRVVQKEKGYRWVAALGAGRLLRAPTVFEDVVKMICTTNCSWALTQVMVRNLCTHLGSPDGNGSFTFPSPGALAASNESFLRRRIRAGYRAPYLLELSRRAAGGELDLEGWRGSDLPVDELYEQVRSVKGVGPYAAGNILKLLGHYDRLGIDSWCRKQFFEIHRNGRKTTDRVIERHYQSFGKWRGLFFWLDLTKPWYEKEFPF